MSLAVAGCVFRWFPGPHPAAVVGVGPVDGVMRITECYDASTADGSPAGYACEGLYTPRSDPQREMKPQGDMTLHRADRKRGPGSIVEVRTAGGEAHELSGGAVALWMTIAWLLFAPLLTLSIWLFACARHASWNTGNGYIYFLLFTMPFSPLAFGLAGRATDLIRALLD